MKPLQTTRCIASLIVIVIVCGQSRTISGRGSSRLVAYRNRHLGGGREDGRRDGFGQVGRFDHHNERLYRRDRQLLFPAAGQRQVPHLGASANLTNAATPVRELKQKDAAAISCLQPMKNQEDWIRQLPGDEFLAALPGDTPEDYRMKTQVRKNCTGCHSASYPLQHRFDAEGWNKLLDLMKHVNVLGVYQGPEHKATRQYRISPERIGNLPHPRARSG